MKIPLAALVLVVAIAPACSLNQEYVDSQRYAFDVRREGPPREPVADTRMAIGRFDASRRYEGEQMVYRLSDDTWETDFYHRFLIAPAEMIAEETSRWFAAAHVTEAVVEPASAVEATHTVEGMVTELLGDYSGKDGPVAVLTMQLFGIGRNASDAPAILVSANYEKRIAVDDRTSAALVAGWEQALSEILTDFEERLAKALTEATP